MAMLGGSDAGALLVADVSIDNTADRLISVRLNLGNVTTWTVSLGTIVAIRDGAEAVEVDVSVPGPVDDDCRLIAGGQTIASSRVVSDAAVLVRFRVTRNHQREAVLAGPWPP